MSSLNNIVNAVISTAQAYLASGMGHAKSVNNEGLNGYKSLRPSRIWFDYFRLLGGGPMRDALQQGRVVIILSDDFFGDRRHVFNVFKIVALAAESRR